MATYKQIQDFVKSKYNYTVKTCWIADIKNLYGLTKRQSPNRIDSVKRKYPCPEKSVEHIKDAFRYYQTI